MFETWHLLLGDRFIPYDLGYDIIMKLRQDLKNVEEEKRTYVVGIEYKNRSKAIRNSVWQKLLEEKLLPWEYGLSA